MRYYIPRFMQEHRVNRRDIDKDIRDARFLVNAGKELLDDSYFEIADADPASQVGWRERITPEALNLRCSHQCLLGQLFGHFRDGSDLIGRYFFEHSHEWDNIHDALDVRLSESVHDSRYRDHTALLGFDRGIVGPDALQIAWLEVITDERYRKASEAAPDQMEMLMDY